MGALLFLGGLKRIRIILAVWLVLGIISHLILTTQDASGVLYRLTGKFKTACALEYIHFFAVGLVFYDVRRHGSWTLGHGLLLATATAMTLWLCQPWEAVVAVSLGLVLYLATVGRLPWLNARPLLWLGFISYPLYLTHQNMGYILLHWMDEHGWNPYLATVVITPGAIAVAALLSYSVEHPIMRKTRELMKKRRAAAGPPLTSTTPQAFTNASL
jgi:peptidoglycan/LPS O-acetylase OafA/YrhL